MLTYNRVETTAAYLHPTAAIFIPNNPPMHRTTLLSKLFALLAIYSLFVPAAVGAQSSQFSIHVNDARGPNQVQHLSGLPGLAMEFDFTVLNAQGEVVPKAEFKSTSIELDNGDTYTAQANKAEDPWSVVILIDASKTMAAFSASGAFKAARTALADSLGQIPDGSNIAILTFDDLPKTIVDFTKDKNPLGDTIRKRITAKNSGNSCLYAGAFDAVNKLSGASGRRALLIMTASADTCGNKLAQDVTNVAHENHIEIYAVGVKGYSVTEQDLTNLTNPTGGLTNMREQGELVFAVENIMKGLSSQFTVKTILFPPAGQRTARLVLTLSDGSDVNSDPVSFESDQDFIRPPEISIKGQVRPIGNSLTFGLTITSADLIEKLTIAVISKKTGDAVLTQDVTDLTTETYKVAADTLKAGDEYTLVVSAVDDKGRTLAQTAAEFKFEPPQTSIEITQVEPTEDKSAFVVEVDSSELEGVVKYKVFLVSSQGSTTVPGTAQTIAVGDPISIPVKNPESGDYLESGTYKVVVQALDSDNKVLAQISSEDIAYERPSAFEIAIKWISERPLAIVGISLACFVAFVGLIAVVWMLLPKPSSKPKTVELVLPEKMRRPPPVEDASLFEKPRRPAERPPQPERPARRPEPVEPERRPSARPGPPSAEVRPAQRPSPAQPQAKPVQYSAPPAPEAKSALPRACLKGQEPANIRSSTEITKSPFTIGRRDGNDLVVKVDNAMGVSGRHATIAFSNNRFYITDDKSTYGVLVNGQKIQPATPVPLEDGMIIGLGPKVKLQFHLTNCP